MVRKKLLALTIILLSIVFLSELIGCAPAKKEEKKKVVTQTIDTAKVERLKDFPISANFTKSIADKAHESVADFTKTYLQKVFLDLNLAKRNNYLTTVAGFYAKNTKIEKDSDISLLSLGQEGKQLDSIVKNDLLIPLTVIYYDKLNNPSLSTVSFQFKAQYLAKSKTIKMDTFGWYVLEKQDRNWKIIDYWVQQSLK